jgi:hypothetical protein
METLLASAARMTSDVSATKTLQRGVRSLTFLLETTAEANEAGDTLDVYIQDSLDGLVWDDLVHFTQVLGNGGHKKFLARVSTLVAPTASLGAPKDEALAEGVRQGPIGSMIRAKWVIGQSGVPADASFTFGINMLQG